MSRTIKLTLRREREGSSRYIERAEGDAATVIGQLDLSMDARGELGDPDALAVTIRPDRGRVIHADAAPNVVRIP